jgi:hypothetical protein
MSEHSNLETLVTDGIPPGTAAAQLGTTISHVRPRGQRRVSSRMGMTRMPAVFFS